jgi:hypothetical protein
VIVADFVRYDLEDGSEVVFETAGAALVEPRGGRPQVVDGGELRAHLDHITRAAEEISRALRERLGPDEIELSFGIKISGKVSWWFIASTAAEAALAVTLRWQGTQEAGRTPDQ